MTAPIVLTMGDPAGIGGEITAAAWLAAQQGSTPGILPFCLIGDVDWACGFGVPIEVIDHPFAAAAAFPRALPVLPMPLTATVMPGQPDTANAGAIIGAIERATALAMAGTASAMVTNPIAKSILYTAGFKHPGHTEFIGALTNTPTPIMMLAGPALRVVPVTVHVSLRRAIETLTTEAIITAATITHAALIRDFAIPTPRLAIAGLNPHAGESGAMGDDETRIIAPAIAGLRAAGIDAFGPLPPDTMFTPIALQGYDAAICMYHDQALIPLKTIDMENSVNITLGLPIIRTSPDHGTAFDIAGKGLARPASLIAALRMASIMAGQRA